MGDDDRETSSSSDPPNATGTVCEHCGKAIDTSDWYPVTKERDSDGSLQFYAFCSEDCQESWLTERRD